MTRTVTVYCFGSTLSNAASANDVDLLIIHPEADEASCRLAIQCKKRISKRVARAHVTMLSTKEEAYFKFVATAHALPLGTVRGDSLDNDVEALLTTMLKRAPMR